MKKTKPNIEWELAMVALLGATALCTWAIVVSQTVRVLTAPGFRLPAFLG